MHYIGDESTGSQHPHGNSKGYKLCIKIRQSVIQSMSNIQIYKRMIQVPQCLPEEQPVLLPHNVKQIKKLQVKDR